MNRAAKYISLITVGSCFSRCRFGQITLTGFTDRIIPESPVFEVLRRFENDEDKLKKYTEVLYDQALLIEGRSIEDPVAYANNVAELLAQ